MDTQIIQQNTYEHQKDFRHSLGRAFKDDQIISKSQSAETTSSAPKLSRILQLMCGRESREGEDAEVAGLLHLTHIHAEECRSHKCATQNLYNTRDSRKKMMKG